MKIPHSMSRNNGPQWQHGKFVLYLHFKLTSKANKAISRVKATFDQVIIFRLFFKNTIFFFNTENIECFMPM